MVSSGGSSSAAVGDADTTKALKRIAEQLMGRALTARDGLDANTMRQTEERLDVAIPVPLKAFYILVGRLPQFMSAFQQFATPEEIYLDGDLLMFLNENQSVCHWGVDTQGRVFLRQNGERYPVELDITAFLQLILYYQVAQGGEGAASRYRKMNGRPYGSRPAGSRSSTMTVWSSIAWMGFWSGILRTRDEEVSDGLLLFNSLIEVPEAMKEQYMLEAL